MVDSGIHQFITLTLDTSPVLFLVRMKIGAGVLYPRDNFWISLVCGLTAVNVLSFTIIHADYKYNLIVSNLKNPIKGNH